MTSDAIAVANYFVDKAKKDRKSDLTLLRLVKYVYIAYGFSMAILDKVIINERFDVVEAWKYGPVIPSVYHSFKHNRNNRITEEAQILVDETMEGELKFETPMILDENVKQILDFVWNKYKAYSTSQLITLLHKSGTPWKYCYKEGENREIPAEMTRAYYCSIVERVMK